MIPPFDQYQELCPDDLYNTLKENKLPLNIFIKKAQPENNSILIFRLYIASYYRQKQLLMKTSNHSYSPEDSFPFPSPQKEMRQNIRQTLVKISQTNKAPFPHSPSQLAYHPGFIPLMTYLQQSLTYLLTIIQNQEIQTFALNNILINQAVHLKQQSHSFNLLIEENKQLHSTMDALRKEHQEQATKQNTFFDSIQEKERLKLERQKQRESRRSRNIQLREAINDPQFNSILETTCANPQRPALQARSRVSFL